MFEICEVKRDTVSVLKMHLYECLQSNCDSNPFRTPRVMTPKVTNSERASISDYFTAGPSTR